MVKVERSDVPMNIIDKDRKPPAHPFYGDNWERGLDPWHADAFPPGFEGVGRTGKRREGWFLLDAWGNAIAFVEDTRIEVDGAPDG